MGILFSVAKISNSPLPILQRLYLRRGVVLAIVAILTFVQAFVVGKHDEAIKAWFIAVSLATLLAALLCIRVGQHANISLAFSALALLIVRMVVIISVDAYRIAEHDYKGSRDSIFLVLQLVISVVYVAFAYMGWQRLQDLFASDGFYPDAQQHGGSYMPVAIPVATPVGDYQYQQPPSGYQVQQSSQQGYSAGAAPATAQPTYALDHYDGTSKV